MKPCFNEVLLVLPQLNFLWEMIRVSLEHTHLLIQRPQKQASSDKETQRGPNAQGQVSNQSSQPYLMTFCVNPQDAYPFEEGQGKRKVSGS